MSNGTSPRKSNLAVRSRQTYWGDTKPTIELSVVCPRRDVDVGVRECVRCAECSGVKVAPDGRETFVLCDAPFEELHVGSSDDDETAAALRSIESIMTTPVICVGFKLSLAILETLFLDSGLQSAPVVDRAGRVTGVVSQMDLVRHHRQRRIAETAPTEHTVGDIMIPKRFALQEKESIPRAAALLAYEGVDRAPVVNANGQVVGLVSALDITRWVAQSHGYVVGQSA